MKVDELLFLLEQRLQVNSYVGVPDSQLQPLCDTLYIRYGVNANHTVAANEGAAVGIAAGHYLATGCPALVYMQNSGIGNAINPIASLLNNEVYGIPCVFVVGWRGEPDVPDEPQHKFQGRITLELLQLLDIETLVLSKETEAEEVDKFLSERAEKLSKGKSIALVVKKDALCTSESRPSYQNAYTMTREDAITCILDAAGREDIFVATTGKTARELFEIRERTAQTHALDFLMVGSMGHASMVSLGISYHHPSKRIWCLDGDGSALMHMGNLPIVASSGCNNMVHVLLNNGAHESVGGMPVNRAKTPWGDIALASGYALCRTIDKRDMLCQAICDIQSFSGTSFLNIHIAQGSRKDLGRPTIIPKENKAALMCYLQKEKIR